MSTTTHNAPALDAQSDDYSTSPLLRLPFEIRLMIYEHLLLPSTTPSTTATTSVANILPDFHTYYSEDTNNDPFTLSVRTVDPWLGAQGSRTWRHRSTYHVRTGSDILRNRRMQGQLLTCLTGPFLTTTTPTTYRILLSPFTAHLRHTIPSLLCLNRQIHAEASKILYSSYTFAFHTSIEAAVPFLSDLTPLSRSHIRHLSLTKKALPYTKEFDRAEWSALCEYIASAPMPPPLDTMSDPSTDVQGEAAPLMRLHTLNLNVIAGRPDSGWDSITPITPADFALMVRLRNEWGGGSLGGVDLEWAEEVMQIKGLREVRVRPLVEHCARPVSEKQAFWVAFSKSVVEGGFGDWVRSVMVG